MTTLGNLKTFCKDRWNGSTEARMDRIFERAINMAHRYIAMRDWPYYLTEGRINTVPTYNTGSLSLTKESNIASSVSGATFSSSQSDWGVLAGSQRGALRVDIASTSALTFETNFQWNGATSSGVSYTLFKDKYALPTDLRKFDCLRDQVNTWKLRDIDYSLMKDVHLNRDFAGDNPEVYTIHKEFFYLYPYPTQLAAIDYWYYRWPTVLSSDASNMDWDEGALDLMHDVLEVCLRMNDPSVETRIRPANGKAEIGVIIDEWRDSISDHSDKIDTMRGLGSSLNVEMEWPLGADE